MLSVDAAAVMHEMILLLMPVVRGHARQDKKVRL